MGIKIKHTDDVYPFCDEIIKPIIDIVCVQPELIEVLCDILTTYNTVEMGLYGKVSRQLEAYGYRFNGNSNYNTFKKALLDFYQEIDAFDFSNKIKKVDEELYFKRKLSKQSVILATYRGLLFEMLVTAVIRSNYSNEIIYTGSIIILDCNLIVANYGDGNSRHKQTFDIIRCISRKGSETIVALYECKVNPDRFDIEHYTLFVKAYQELKAHTGVDVELYLFTAENSLLTRKHLEIIERSSEEKVPIIVYGRDNIHKLL